MTFPCTKAHRQKNTKYTNTAYGEVLERPNTCVVEATELISELDAVSAQKNNFWWERPYFLDCLNQV